MSDRCLFKPAAFGLAASLAVVVPGVRAEPFTFEFEHANSAVLSVALGSSAANLNVQAQGSMSVEFDADAGVINVTSFSATVLGASGQGPIVPVTIGLFGPLAVSHTPLAVSLTHPTAPVAVGPLDDWEIPQAELRLDAHQSYHADPLQCSVLSSGQIPCQASRELEPKTPSIARFHACTIEQSPGEIAVSACVEVRVPHRADFPGLEWTRLQICFEAQASACLADLTGDGNADLADLVMFLTEWQPRIGSPAAGSFADLTADGVIDLADLVRFLESWLPGCP